MQLER